ncbi:uncharacterized protein LOC121391530 [Gigantopelta aegis]|uniref:uncharacterized protein LOC121391530 n=1 Tax=Gigantopelta aegis TaxID=1735272 RepID=UPI001B88E2EC|nr:uncharacterized protein LOC121391530 [Gigantopelta aegis]
MKIFIFLLAVTVVYGQHSHSCVHSNHDMHTADHVIDWVIREMDHNQDGNVSDSEIIAEFIISFDTHPHDLKIDHDEFVHRWQNHYRDVRHFAEYLWLHMDTNHDHVLDSGDLTAIIRDMDGDLDGTVTTHEFKLWMEDLYKNCKTVQRP